MAQISGLDELERFARDSVRGLRDALPGAVDDGAAIVENEIRARAPRRTGELVEHLDVTPAAVRRDSASAVVEIRDSGPGGEARQAVYVEYGTSRTPAEPFFRPGVEAARSRAEGRIENTLLGVIERHER